MATNDTCTGGSKRAEPDILRGEDPPGEWTHRSVSGTTITYALWPPYTIDEFDNIPEGWVVELVLEKKGEFGDEDRPADVWVVDYPADHIVDNYSDSATVIGEYYDDLDQAAMAAVSFMRANPGKERSLDTDKDQ